ncbi:MAG: toxin-antitoxin system YwqK family antitoxin [Bacteroidetes bacterium]|jgi:antitoxin component YwqK of YwqJK toxin-antitoxin module|nr:toxin-antitoxin system YwqK family antitoxin [Bacteroidota bacterium]
MSLRLLFALLFTVLIYQGFAQQNDSLTIFYHPNGEKSSEGKLVDGKPDGYWRTYYEDGILKSEGNRLDFELDSLWKFYDEQGNLILEINYKQGIKDGERKTYLSNEILVERFEKDVKTGLTERFDKQGRLLQSIPFEQGLENGIARLYDTTGNIIELITYQKGFIVDRERINGYDSDQRRHGRWKWFYADGLLQSEGVYKHGLKNGFFKEYDKNGNLKKIVKYIDGVLQEQAEELALLDMKRDYYPNGKVKVEATYRNGVAEGIRREFDEQGNVEKAFTFKHGTLVAEGIIAANGQRQGFWKYYYPNGGLKSQGNYTDDVRSGEWEFFHTNGVLEQRGSYNENGQPIGLWKWFYNDGKLLRDENYRDGLLDGILTEYGPQGRIITQGDYIDGLKEGFWFYETGDMRMEGNYSGGMRNGNWKYIYSNGQLAFEGRFVDDNPNGTHTFYYPDGAVRETGNYVMGRKNGDWKRYLEDGSLVIVINYNNGVERKYDGIEIAADELIITD